MARSAKTRLARVGRMSRRLDWFAVLLDVAAIDVPVWTEVKLAVSNAGAVAHDAQNAVASAIEVNRPRPR